MTKDPGNPGGLADALARIAERSASLSRLDDEYLRLITRTEEALRALNVGVYVYTAVDSRFEPESHSTFSRLLAFGKIGGSWRLLVESGYDQQDPDQWDSTPLASCDRDLRFTVFADGHIETLIRKAVEGIEQAVAKRELHLGPSTALVTAIEQARPSRPAKGGKP